MNSVDVDWGWVGGVVAQAARDEAFELRYGVRVVPLYLNHAPDDRSFAHRDKHPLPRAVARYRPRRLR